MQKILSFNLLTCLSMFHCTQSKSKLVKDLTP